MKKVDRSRAYVPKFSLNVSTQHFLANCFISLERGDLAHDDLSVIVNGRKIDVTYLQPVWMKKKSTESAFPHELLDIS